MPKGFRLTAPERTAEVTVPANGCVRLNLAATDLGPPSGRAVDGVFEDLSRGPASSPR